MNKESISIEDIAKGVRLPRFKKLQFAYASLAASIVFAPLAIIPLVILINLGAYRYQKYSYMGARYIQLIAVVYLVLSVVVCILTGCEISVWILIPKLFLLFALHRAIYSYHHIVSRQSNISFAREAYKYMIANNEQELLKNALRIKVKDDEY